MSLEKYIFSDKILDNLTHKLLEKFEINGSGVDACRKLVHSQMTKSYQYNKQNYAKENPRVAIKKLSNECFERCRKYLLSKGIKPRQRQVQQQQYPMMTDNGSGVSGYDTGSGQYASFSAMFGNGEYIRADGMMGGKFLTADDVEKFMNNKSRSESRADIEQAMMLRKMEYDAMSGANMNGMGMMNGGGMGMMNPMMGMAAMGMGGMGLNNRPPEIDFSLDGGGKKKQQEEFSNMNGMGMNMMGGGMGMMNNGMPMGMDMNSMMGGGGMTGMMGNGMPGMDMNAMMGMNMMGGGGMGMNPMMGNMPNMNGGMGMNTAQMPTYDPNFIPPTNLGNFNMNYSQYNSNQNFRPNGVHTPAVDITNDPVYQQNLKLKQELEDQIGIDPQALMRMSAKDIEGLLKSHMLGKNGKKNRIDDEDDTDNFLTNTKTSTFDKIQALLKLKQTNLDNLEQLNEKVGEVEKEFKKKKVKHQQEIEPEPEGEELVIDSNNYDDDGKHNNYNMEFEDVITDITCIKLNDIKLPFFSVNETNNNFTIKIDGEEYEISLDDVNTVPDIVKMLNNQFEDAKIDISVEIDDGIVKFVKNQGVFSLIFNNELGKMMGFYKEEYEGENEYSGETCYMSADEPINMFIEEVSKNKPYAQVTPNNFKQLIKKVNTDLSGLTIKFKNKYDKLANFGGLSHTLTLVIY